MRVKFINRMTGSIMYVAEERAKEYAAAGHKPAAASAKAEKPEQKQKASPKKRGTTKKAGA